MKVSIKWATIATLSGLIILIIFFSAFPEPSVPPKGWPSPNHIAARYAVQAALQYAAENENILPETLNQEQIRQAFLSSALYYEDADIPISKIIYLPPKERNLSNVISDTALVVVPHENGAHIGYVSGAVTFLRTGKNINLTTGAQQISDGNAEKPPVVEQEP